MPIFDSQRTSLRWLLSSHLSIEHTTSAAHPPDTYWRPACIVQYGRWGFSHGGRTRRGQSRVPCTQLACAWLPSRHVSVPHDRQPWKLTEEHVNDIRRVLVVYLYVDGARGPSPLVQPVPSCRDRQVRVEFFPRCNFPLRPSIAFWFAGVRPRQAVRREMQQGGGWRSALI